MPETENKMERCILLMCDDWSITKDGISGVNRTLALSLSRYKGIKVYSTVFQPEGELGRSDREEAEKCNVTLISPSNVSENPYTDINTNPLGVFDDIQSKVPFVSHIVGHSPITADAARKLKEELYPDSKLILFYHVIPGDVDWLAEQLPYVVPTDTEMVQAAEEADVVYSVLEKVHWYYTAKFRNRAAKPIDHRLFLPQCSEDVFSISRGKPVNTSKTSVLSIINGTGKEEWEGLDIAECGVNKVTMASMEGSQSRPAPVLVTAAINKQDPEEGTDSDYSQLTREQHVVQTPEDLYKDVAECSLSLVPARAEPFGHVGLHALSAGIPTLIAEESALATLVRRLTSEPEYFLVPVTPTRTAVRQDGSVWRDRILSVIQDLGVAHERATQLRMALRRDEPTKESHDNFISYCLGGICIKHEATAVEFMYRKDEDKELPVLRSFNKFLVATLKQCWRLKHHPLTQEGDLFQILPGVELPTKQLMESVTDKIEEFDRRIVGVDDETDSFVVYCPTVFALTDLWAMCDVINNALVANLLSGDESMILDKFRLRSVDVRTIISGPEYLQYKQQLVQNNRACNEEES